MGVHDRFPSAAGMLVAACLLAAGGAWLPETISPAPASPTAAASRPPKGPGGSWRAAGSEACFA